MAADGAALLSREFRIRSIHRMLYLFCETVPLVHHGLMNSVSAPGRWRIPSGNRFSRDPGEIMPPDAVLWMISRRTRNLFGLLAVAG